MEPFHSIPTYCLSDMEFQDLSAYVQQQVKDKSKARLRAPSNTTEVTLPGTLVFGQYKNPSLTYFGKVPDSTIARFPGLDQKFFQ